MLKIGFCFFLFQSLAVSQIHAQNFSAYLIGGFNISQIEGDKLTGYNKAGVVAGGATNFRLNDNWSLQQEIVFYQRGSRASDEELDADDFTKLRLDYIDILFLPVYHIVQKWSISGGVGYGVFLSSESDFQTGVDFTGDLFLTLGPQYQLTDNWLAAVRIQFSMLDVIDNRDALNNSLNLTLRYQL